MFTICLFNLIQFQVEKTINLNMSIQTILSKFPSKNSTEFLNKSNVRNENDCETYFESIFNYVIKFFILF